MPHGGSDIRNQLMNSSTENVSAGMENFKAFLWSVPPEHFRESAEDLRQIQQGTQGNLKEDRWVFVMI